MTNSLPGATAQSQLSGETYRFPVSFAQLRLWFLDQLSPGSTSYLIPWALRIRGPLDATALAASLNGIVARHEIFRTHFEATEGEAVQVVHAAAHLELTRHDLSHLEPSAAEQQARQWMQREAETPMSLDSAPLLRASLLQLGTQDHVLLLTTHHIIFDGWSRSILVRELDAFYRAARQGVEAALPEMPIQYADFAIWQQQNLTGEYLSRQLDYWKQQLAGIPASLEIPTDRPRPAVQTFNGHSLHFRLSAELTQQVKQCSQAESVTPFMLLLAVFQLLLARYTGQQDIVVGTPIANRTRPELEGIIGLFANTLTLRTRLEGDPTLRELLARVRETALAAYAHEETPFEQLVQELHPERSLSHSPLFQVLFSQRNTPGGSFHLDDLEVEFFAGSGDTSKYDLSLYLEEHSDGYHGKFEYNTDLYDKTTIERILGHYRQLLAEVLQDTSRPLSHYQILTAAERTQLLETWNATAQAYPEALCVHLLFEQQAAARPQAIAVATDEATITYAELNRRANQLAHLLLQLGVGTGQRVGLFLERSLAMFVGLLGVQKAGAAYVPLDPAYPVERIRATLEAAGVSCLVTMQDLLPLLAAPACPVLCLDENHATDHDRLAACPETNPQTPVTAEDSIYVIFTSGSTGKPKGVELKHRGVVNLLEWMRAELRFDEQGVFPALASFAFDMSVPELYLALVSGGKVALGRRHLPADGEALASFLRRHGATLVHATPTTWSLLLDAGYTGHEVIRCIGAEPLPAELFGRLMDAAPGVPLYNFYGPTETTVWSTYQRLTSRADRITIGRPLANTQVYLVDSEGHPVPIGVPGEILIGGDGVARCYLNQPELTAEKFIPDTFRGRPDARVYRTGDLGRYLPDGRIEFAGRIDHQVKVRGYRIELGEIETVLSQLEAVREAVVMAREDEDGDKRLVAYVVFHAGASLSVPEMRTWVKQNLPEYMVPAAVVVLERMPLSPNGKVDRKALPSPMAEAPVARQPMDGPVQEMIANVWAEVLKTGEITPESNFFELGGHSLLAAKVVARIRQALHVPLPLSVVFEAPTLAEMAARVAALVREDNTPVESPLVAMQSGEAAPLSFAQQRLWFLDQLQPGSSFYNVPMAMRLTGPLDRAALVRAIEAMMEHQPSLRTCFAVQGEQPVQIIVPSLPTPLTEVDLSDLPVAEREEKAQALVRAEAGSSFNLAVPPLFRVLLVRLAAEDHVFMINLHHAISDGWSLGVVTNELVLLYEAFRKGESSPLPPLPLTYADYAVWQKRYLEAGALERQLGYWRQHMAGAPLAIDLPTDRVRPVMQTFSGSKQVVLFPAHLLERLKELSRAQGATLFITLLTAFDVLLARYSGQYDIVIGTAIAGRHHAETEKLIGYFANTLVLRNQVPGNQTFQQLMHSVRETTLNAFANQDVPFEKLVEELNPPRDTSRSPLFQVMLIQQNAFQRGSTFGSLQSVPYSAASGAAKVDLILNVAEDQGRLRCALEYNTDLYNAETIDRMLENYGALLESAVQQPDIPVAELALQRAEDREQLLFGWNKTTREYPHFTTVHQLFEQQVWRAPHATAVICDDTRLTYQELNQQANQLAAMLRARGVRQGDRVGIYLERSVPMMVALLGVQKSGAAYIPLDPAYPAERLSLVVQDAEIAMMLTEERLLAGMPQFSGSVVCLDREAEAIAAFPPEDLPPLATPDDTIYVIFTSGSTGRPKGVDVPNRGVVNLLTWMAQELAMGPADVVPVLASFGFDMSIPELYLALTTGGAVLLTPRMAAADGEALAALLQRHQATMLHATPTTWGLLLDAGFTGAGLKRCIGAEALPRELFLRLMQAAEGTPLYNLYGPTETTVWSTFHRFTSAEERITIGRPIANTQVYILDEQLQPVPVGVPGGIYISGDGVTRGYLGRPDLTAEKFLPHPFLEDGRLYVTGDVGRYLPDGRIEYLQRADHQVKIRGFRIELGEIEAVLAAHPALRESVVVAREDQPGMRSLAAYYVAADPAQTVEPGELRDFLKSRLPDYMIPSGWMQLERLPVSPNGKVDRKALPAPETLVSRSANGNAPSSTVEVRLATIWEEVLNVTSVSLDDDFFSLGGHSLLAVQMMTRAREAFGFDLPLTLLFSAPRLGELARVIQNERGKHPFKTIIPIRKGGNRPPLFCVARPNVNALGFVFLMRHLAPEQPVIGLQAQMEKDGSSWVYDQADYEAKAAEYIQAMREAYPDGPYFLTGYCEGAHIAFEMARMLEAQGLPVAMLAILDAWPVENTVSRTKYKLRGYLREFRKFRKLSLTGKLHFLTRNRFRKQQTQAALDPVAAAAAAKAAEQLRLANEQLRRRYWPGPDFVPTRWGGRLTLFRTDKQLHIRIRDYKMGWGQRALGGVDVIRVEGDHFLMLREPYVVDLAHNMQRVMDEAYARWQAEQGSAASTKRSADGL